jgi:hypothetical protein
LPRENGGCDLAKASRITRFSTPVGILVSRRAATASITSKLRRIWWPLSAETNSTGMSPRKNSSLRMLLS